MSRSSGATASMRASGMVGRPGIVVSNEGRGNSVMAEGMEQQMGSKLQNRGQP